MRYKEWCAISPRTDRQKRAYMKKIVKAAFVALAAIMAFSSFAGCGNKRSANSATDIEISFWVAGFGEKFMDDIIAGFN